MQVLEAFIESEFYNNEVYIAIMNFIISNNIRKGEYKGVEYVIKKMDTSNFIIYAEYNYPDGTTGIQWAEAVDKDILVIKINEFAAEKAYDIIA